jgi:hypothetical protein
MTPELKAAIAALLAAAEHAANHWQTASVIVTPLRAAINAVRDAMKEVAK